MAEDKKKEAPAAEAAPAEGAAPKKGKPMKLVAIVGGVMVLEAVALFMVLGATSAKPQGANAAELHGKDVVADERTIEVPLLEEEFQTMQGSQIWIWDTNIVLQVKKKNETHVTQVLEERAAEISEAIAQMFRRASPNQLREPGMETLNRQVTAFMAKLLGKDSEGKERLEKVLIPKCRGFFAN
jgi:flagellar basal body-associated protein FliL